MTHDFAGFAAAHQIEKAEESFMDGRSTFAETMLWILDADPEIHAMTRDAILRLTAIAHRMEREALEKEQETYSYYGPLWP